MRDIVIIPAYNEEATVGDLLKEILVLPLEGLDVLVVDDHSTDRTALRVKDAASRTDRIKLLQNDFAQRGLAFCYKTGFRHALSRGYDRFITMDADFSHNPADLAKFFSGRDEADWLIGSRYCSGGRAPGLSFFRSLLSRLANAYIRARLKTSVMDMTSGFNCLKRTVLETVDFLSIPSGGFIFQAELKALALRKRFALKEIPISFERRRAGRSKFSLAIMLESLQRMSRLKAPKD